MIKYITVKYGGCCGRPEKEVNVPDNITPHQLSLLIPEISLEEAIELLSRRIKNDPSCNSFSSKLIQRQVRKECLPPAQGSLVTITIPAGKYISKLSQEDADRQAEEEFKKIAQITANKLGVCTTPNCVGCNSFRVTRTIACGEYRRNTECINGQCVDTSPEYFVCTGNCDGDRCKQPCTTCSPTCPKGTCPQGYNCISGSCVRNCENASCSLECPNGSCKDPCTECKNGRCQPKSCPSGQICQDGRCIDRPCNPPCSERVINPGPNDCIQRSIVQICQSGKCVDSTQEKTVNIREGLPCGTNKICRNGVCSDKPCVNQGGSCNTGDTCCSGSFCFNGTCVSSCPQGYIQQGGTCVVDNSPVVLVTQQVTTNTSHLCFLGNVVNSYPCSHFSFNVLPTGILNLNFSNGQSVPRFKDAYIGYNNPFGLSNGQCNSNFCFYEASYPLSWGGVNNAIRRYIEEQVNPNLLGYYQVLYPMVQGCGAGANNRLPDTCSTTVNIYNFTVYFQKMSTSVPEITNLQGIGGSTSLQSQTTAVISNVNPYGLSPYTPTPSTWSGFGFDGSWKNFNLNSNMGDLTLQGRIAGSTLEIRKPDNTPVFGSSSFTNQRLIGTFTVGTTVTKTLQ